MTRILKYINVVLIFICLIIATRFLWVSGIALDEYQSFSEFYDSNYLYLWGTAFLLFVLLILSIYIAAKKD